MSNSTAFPYVKTLNLSGNKIDSLPPIELRNLTHLNLNNNVINNLEDFYGHKKLQILELRGNKLKDLKGLVRLDSLKELYVAENNLESLNGIEDTPCLKKIHARKNKIVSFAAFPDLKGLIYLNLRENLVTKIDDVAKVCESVQILNLLGNPLSEEMGDNVKKEIWMRFRHY